MAPYQQAGRAWPGCVPLDAVPLSDSSTGDAGEGLPALSQNIEHNPLFP